MTPTTLPSTESAVTIPTVVAICTVIIGALGYLIARGQLKISVGQAGVAERKLKMDLFDRRYKIYLAAREFLFSIIRHNNVVQNEWVAFNLGSDEHVFLFEQDMSDYLNSIGERAKVIVFMQQTTERSLLTSQLLEEQHQLVKRFKPYLNVTTVR